MLSFFVFRSYMLGLQFFAFEPETPSVPQSRYTAHPCSKIHRPSLFKDFYLFSVFFMTTSLPPLLADPMKEATRAFRNMAMAYTE